MSSIKRFELVNDEVMSGNNKVIRDVVVFFDCLEFSLKIRDYTCDVYINKMYRYACLFGFSEKKYSHLFYNFLFIVNVSFACS